MTMKTILLAGVACLSAVPVAARQPAAAASQASYEVSIPSQSLEATLLQIARKARLQLVFTDARVTTLRARVLRGRYTPPEMLDRVLSGTGFTYRYTGANSVRIIPLAEARQGGVTPASFDEAPRGSNGAMPALAREPAEEPGAEADEVEEIVVVGSQIRGVDVAAALPVTVVGQDQIAATAAVSGDELFRSIPQLGDVSFNSEYLPNSSNAARGDVGSVNLRNLGVGNTLVLINGRRMVAHPTSRADDNLVPVLTYNANAIPVSGVARLEVLRDGAAAIYGSDAVAGVVNTVLRQDYEGVSIGTQYGLAEGTGMHEFNVTGLAGASLGGGRGNVTIFADYTHRSALRAADQSHTASDDKRPLFIGTPFEGSASLDGRSTTTPWGYFQAVGASGAVLQNGTALTSRSGYFHIQPQANQGCLTRLAGGICIDDGSLSTSSVDRNLRYDRTAASNRSILPETDRTNLFATGHYDLTDDVELFGEAGLYLARTRSIQTATYTLSSATITVPASNYYNPFGALTLPDGSVNPNRLPGLTNVPAAGLPVALSRYDFSDTGPNEVVVKNSQYRLLGGMRWRLAGFDFESAGLYSEARVHDISDGLSATLLQGQLALATPDAYNPFNGGNLENPDLRDDTASSVTSIDAIRVRANRISRSTLALADLKVSRGDLFRLAGGAVGIALGGEVRRETQSDDRDPRVDGATTFTDLVTGIIYDSDLIGTSASPDVDGARTVTSAWAELAVPLISPEMNVPFARAIELQLAGRFEHYSDVGSIAKPKIAGYWDVFDGIRLRGSYSEGFKAPNLEQVNANLVTRSNTRTDYIRCEADLRTGLINDFDDCSRSGSTISRRSGNPNLKPEESTSWSAGIVLRPRFIPPRFGDLTLTADYWDVKQTGIVGLFGDGNALILDYLRRLEGGSNPDVVRADPTEDDIAAFQGTGLAPVGQVLHVEDRYRNLLPQEASGIDLGLVWTLRNTAIGSFSLALNAAYLRKFYLSPAPDVAALIAARDAGEINRDVFIFGGGDLIRQNGKPEWKASGTLTWSYGRFQLGGFTQYTGPFDDTGLTYDDGRYWQVAGRTTFNLYGQITVGDEGDRQFRFRLGARNLLDARPPLESDAGYAAALYTPYRRYLYANVRTTF